jgi:predicted DCC family thiol-disulfide oxidoreductase YuxK
VAGGEIPPRVVLFDGVCNLCDASVTFVIDRDPAGEIRFAALQSEVGQALRRRFRVPDEAAASVLFVEDGRCYRESTAALRICRYLSGWWPLLAWLLVLPVPVRDLVYRWIARNRYRWFGVREACRVPTPELRARFLDQVQSDEGKLVSKVAARGRV